ncbi:MAG TPA: HDOD domain-containing protein [Burkholderiaceae bacterium]|nr:HDOD domain-containing protein [Burkholderiaceae bacterium]
MELSELLASEAALPSIPKVVVLLVSETNRPEPDLRHISQLLGTDPALTMRTLQMANSSLLPMPGKISSVSEALAILGLNHLRSLAAAATRGSAVRAIPGINLQQFWRYSLNVAKLSRSFAGKVKQNSATAFTAGLIHAMGELVMHSVMPEKMAAIGETTAPFDLRRAKIEHRALGYCFAEVSAGLARQWQFPGTLVDALQHQYTPFDNDAYEPLAGVLHLAGWRARAKEAGLTDRELAVSFPGEVGLTMGLDIDMVLQQHPIDWTSGNEAGEYI